MFDFKCECEALPTRRFAAGEVVIEEGAKSGALYFLIDGSVEISRDGTLVAKLDTPGLVLGEISILLDRTHIAEVRAVEDCSFHVAEDPEKFLHDHPKVSLYIARSLAKKVDVTTCYLVDLKQQYGAEEGQLGMVHEVIDSLLQVKH
ncbi:cyclic nucleotide-binding domain-containing protein [Haloferula rosea]|uniref:Cyclic nucleotide-binding domain-containing protein n=1 Tax=Haloferula rosea TaxID=490093 RepID=A0A934REM8_9BACT|nr:cyclic nucleotide-binding domain-containing protein [Haloferula rosea]MBK1828253.1 cyclic nucleotide-binding domain-containing protein [Haloferula rosea]